MHLFVCHGTDTRDRGKHTLLSSPRSWSSSVTSSRRGSDSVLPFGESGAKRRYLGREPLLTFWNGRDSRSGGEENKKNGRPGLARINAKTRIDRETRRERVHDSQEGRLGARASLGGTKEEEGERKGKKGGGEHPLRHLEVNGTAKVYFVAERTGCHATMAPWWGCNGPRGTKRATGKRDRVEAVRRSEEEREREGEGRRGI